MQFQEDITNWMHPLGFAYYPDGAHGFKQYAEVAFAFIELNAKKVLLHTNKYLFASGSRTRGTSSGNVQRAAVPLQPQQPIFQGTSNESLE